MSIEIQQKAGKTVPGLSIMLGKTVLVLVRADHKISSCLCGNFTLRELPSEFGKAG